MPNRREFLGIAGVCAVAPLIPEPDYLNYEVMFAQDAVIWSDGTVACGRDLYIAKIKIKESPKAAYEIGRMRNRV